MTAQDGQLRKAERAVWVEFGLELEERFIEVGEASRRVRVLECGDPAGTPLVFVQGGLGEGLGWVNLLAKLGDFRCITLDRPGGGLSDGVDFTQVDVRRLAEETLAAVLDDARLDEATFVANSMGAWWSLQLARARPARVTRLALLGCPAILLDTSAPLPMRLMSLPLLGPAMAARMAPSSPDKTRGTPEFLGHPKAVGQGWSRALAEANYLHGNLPNNARSWATLLRRFLRLTGSNPELRIGPDELRAVAQPTLFLWGEKDPFGSVEAGRAAVKLMPDARLETVGVGHLPWWDQPDECARKIRDFISDSSAG